MAQSQAEQDQPSETEDQAGDQAGDDLNEVGIVRIQVSLPWKKNVEVYDIVLSRLDLITIARKGLGDGVPDRERTDALSTIEKVIILARGAIEHSLLPPSYTKNGDE